jgi:hypothetical protein
LREEEPEGVDLVWVTMLGMCDEAISGACESYRTRYEDEFEDASELRSDRLVARRIAVRSNSRRFNSRISERRS